MKNNQLPEVRFPGWKDDWELLKLSNVVKLFGGNAFKSSDAVKNGARWLKIANVGIGYTTWEDKSFLPLEYLEKFSNYRLEVGVFVMALTRPILNHELKISKVMEDDVLLNQRVARLDFETNTEFGYQLLRKRSTVDSIENDLAGTDPPNLSTKNLEKVIVAVPNPEEQKKIGAFFKQIDDTISFYQQELTALKQTKQGFLQKMFPKEGEKVPEVRFPGYIDVWEQCKLSVGMTEYTDRVFIQEDKNYKQVSVKNIGEIVLRGEKSGSKIGRKRQAKVNLKDHPNTLIFTRQTVEQGGIGFAPKETDGAIVTENMPTIDINEKKIDCNYLLAYVKTQEWYRHVILKNIEGGTAQVAIHEDSILSSEVLIPKIDEQQKIGTFFKQLDNTIALHQRELEILKNTKKAFFQKMFV